MELNFPKTDALAITDPIFALPNDILNVVMSILPIQDVWSLELTSKKIQPRVELLNLARTQKNLENIIHNLLEKLTKGKFTWHGVSKEYHALYETIDIFPNNSKEKCQQLRDLICSLCNRTYWVTFIDLMEPYPFFEDKFLPVQAIEKNFISGQNSINRNGLIDDKIMLLILKMLKENRLYATFLSLRNLKISPNSKALELLRGAIEKNHLLNILSLKIERWEPSDLQAIVEVVKNNKRIKKVYIAETQMDKYCDVDMTNLRRWLQEDQLKHYDELYQIFSNELGSSGPFQRQTDMFYWERKKTII